MNIVICLKLTQLKYSSLLKIHRQKIFIEIENQLE